jgi:hypothetical protein
MSAGTGVRHSEKNASSDEPVHFLQIWILPARRGLPPGYEQKHYPQSEKRGRLRLVGSPDGRDGSVTIHQDVLLSAGLFARGERATYTLAAGRAAYLHVAQGAIDLDGHPLRAGDGATVTEQEALTVSGIEEGQQGQGEEGEGRDGGRDGEVLLFDLP